MSEVILKAILRLFAVVARQDSVTHHERDQIRAFLREHLNRNAIESYLTLFDEYSKANAGGDFQQEIKTIEVICTEINAGLTQKQKVVILLELMRIVLADTEVSAREEELVHTTSAAFRIQLHHLETIKTFVGSQDVCQTDHEGLLVIDANDDAAFKRAHHFRRK